MKKFISKYFFFGDNSFQNMKDTYELI